MRLILDLDNTLYPAKCGLLKAIDDRIAGFVSQKLKVDFEEGHRIRYGYYKRYGTTIGGLMAEHSVTAEEFYGYIHDIDIFEYLPPNPALRVMLESINMPKDIFTNSPETYAPRVIEALGLEGLFEGLYCIEFCEFHSKPQAFGFQKLHDKLRLGETGAIFVDDQARNLVPAAELGWKVIHYNEDGMHETDGRFAEIRTLDELPAAIEELV